MAVRGSDSVSLGVSESGAKNYILATLQKGGEGKGKADVLE